MKKEFFLMRHGQTLFNARRKIQGWCDSPLTEEGVRQAKGMASYFENKKIQHVYSSTSERTLDTAHHATNGQFNVIQLKGLKEINFGLLEGESADLFPRAFADGDIYFSNYGGETNALVTERMVDTCKGIMDQDDHQAVLAVSHCGSCLNFLSHWQSLDTVLAEGVPNCTVFHFEYEDGQFKLLDIIRPE